VIGTIWGAAAVGLIGGLAWLGWRRGGAVAVLVVLALHALSQDHHVDDAGIVYAYAQNLAAGHGLVPQPGAAVVEGISDPLWMLMLVPAGWVGADVGAWASVLQAALMIFVIFGVGRLAALSGADARGVGVARLATATSGVVFAWTTAGLEGALMAALLVAVAWAAASRAGLAVLFGVWLCAWVRPEGAAAGVGLALAGLMLGRRDDESWSRLLRSVVWPLAGAALGLLWLHGARYLLLGTLLPTSALAKLGTPSWRYLVGGGLYAGTALGLAGLPALAVGWLRTEPPRRWLLPLGVVVLTGAGLAVASGGDWMRHGRFLAPYVPVLLALGVPPLVAGWREHPLCRVGLSAGLVVGWGVLVDAAWRPTVPVDHGLRRGELYAAIGTSACGQPSVATPDIGGVIWAHPQVRVLDLAGLIDAEAATGRLEPDYWVQRVARDRPALIDLHDSWARRTGLTDAVLQELGYRILARRQGVTEPGQEPTLWIRDDCPAEPSERAQALLQQWQAHGSGRAWRVSSQPAPDASPGG